jgi:phosphoglycolate phosphatase-like HAD superfamily hydrolase
MAASAATGTNQPLQHPFSSSNPPTIFCDFDGPIVDVSDRYYSTYQLGLATVRTAYRAKGVTLPLHLLTKEQFWQMKQERTPDTEIALRSGLTGRQIDLFLKRVIQIVNQPSLLQHDQIQPGVKWALSLLHTQGVELVLVTLRCQEQATRMLQENGLDQLFSQIWGSQDHRVAYANQAQHKTELLTQAMSCLASKGSPAWMIGDTEADILAGQATGIATIALTCGIRSRNYLQQFAPTHIHSDLLAAAHYLVKAR